eukprot:TRINITY_DN84498_c0_g1_i1.p1 TRINITY_DN84498_c0_g1~~TRINITY_DN84498_c0_g1_i1.p1  ORF type:complete len:165 (+),score=16.63 TRINITY_DN84498_c0_g1_i1:264-758(+)
MPHEKYEIVWDHAQETGYEVTDARHESLTCLYNDHIRYLKCGVSHVALRRSFDILLHELKLHFREDCAFADSLHFSKLQSFRSTHHEKIHMIDDVFRRSIDDLLIRQFTPILRSWMHFHLDWGHQLTREFDPQNVLTHLPPYPKVNTPEEADETAGLLELNGTR